MFANEIEEKISQVKFYFNRNLENQNYKKDFLFNEKLII